MNPGRKKNIDPVMNRIIGECIMFRLSPQESEVYIRLETGKTLKPRTIRKKKQEWNDENSVNAWLSEFTRIGFLQFQKENIARIQKLLDDAYRQLYEETVQEKPNLNNILRLRRDIRESTALLHEFQLGTPSLAAVRERLKKKKLLDPLTE
jgi:hypothetical protein